MGLATTRGWNRYGVWQKSKLKKAARWERAKSAPLYRYYETAAEDGYIDYDSAVQYPFGYGLSYTSFEQSIEGYSSGNGTINMLVKVTNTGSAAGKDVAQVYYTAP